MSTTTTPIDIRSHNAIGAFADQVREFLDDTEVPATVSLTVNLYSGGAWFEVTQWDTDRCFRCEQTLNLEELPGPATAFDQFGARSGEYAFQHGCGGHNYPSEALVWVSEGDDLDEALAGILTELEAKVAAHLDKLNAEWVARGERELAGVQAELDAITDAEERAEFLSGYDAPSGEFISVIWDEAREELFAEVYVPTLTENPVPELVRR